MRKCKGCNECSGMCRETWEPLGELGRIEKLLIAAGVVLFLTGMTILVVY